MHGRCFRPRPGRRYVWGGYRKPTAFWWIGSLLAGLLLPVPAPAQLDTLRRLPSAQRYEAIRNLCLRSLHGPNPDTNVALDVRRRLGLLFQNAPVKDQLLWQTAVLHCDLYKRFHTEQFPARGLALLRSAEAEHDTLLIAANCLILGRYYYQLPKNYYLAFLYFGRTQALLRNRTNATFPDHNYTLYYLALASYQFFDYEKAIQVGRSLHATPPDPLHQGDRIYNACLLGLAYYHRSRYDSARYFFDWGLRHLPVPAFNNDVWMGILSGNLGRTLAKQGRPAAAIPYLKQGLAYTARAGVWDNVAPFGQALAELHLRQGLPERAGLYARLAHQAAHRAHQPELLYQTHRTLADYYRRVGLATLALSHADSAATAKEGWQREMDVTLKHRAEMTLETERNQARERLLESERNRQVLLRNALLGFLVLAAGIAGLLFNRRVVAERQRQQQLRAEKERAETDLRHAVAQLESFTRNVQEKTALLETLAPEGTEPAYPEVFDQLRRSVLLTEENWAAFSELFERVHAGFLHRLHQTYPALTPAEIRFAALTRLGYFPREMAAMLGVGTDAIRQLRSRLRRKLSLPEEASLEEVVAKV